MFGLGKKKAEDGERLTQPIPQGWSIVDLGLLGSGGMSRVYRVRDETLEREVALKVLRPQLNQEPSALAQFVDEARITAQLNHPNIPPVYALSTGKALAIRAVASIFLDVSGQTAALLEDKLHGQAVELALRGIALNGQNLPGGGRGVAWSGLLRSIVKQTGLEPDAITAQLKKRKGLRIDTASDQLILSRD